MTRTGGMRPRTLCEVARRAKSEPGSFDLALREFLDAFYLMAEKERPVALRGRPIRLGSPHDAYLAAVAEHLARRFALAIPEWTDAPSRFLHRPFFAGGLESLKATLLVESPAAFRRRLLFVGKDALSRPREFAAGYKAPR